MRSSCLFFFSFPSPLVKAMMSLPLLYFLFSPLLITGAIKECPVLLFLSPTLERKAGLGFHPPPFVMRGPRINGGEADSFLISFANREEEIGMLFAVFSFFLFAYAGLLFSSLSPSIPSGIKATISPSFLPGLSGATSGHNDAISPLFSFPLRKE